MDEYSRCYEGKGPRRQTSKREKLKQIVHRQHLRKDAAGKKEGNLANDLSRKGEEETKGAQFKGMEVGEALRNKRVYLCYMACGGVAGDAAPQCTRGRKNGKAGKEAVGRERRDCFPQMQVAKFPAISPVFCCAGRGSVLCACYDFLYELSFLLSFCFRFVCLGFVSCFGASPFLLRCTYRMIPEMNRPDNLIMPEVKWCVACAHMGICIVFAVCFLDLFSFFMGV